jgi:hypothetical protein
MEVSSNELYKYFIYISYFLHLSKTYKVSFFISNSLYIPKTKMFIVSHLNIKQRQNYIYYLYAGKKQHVDYESSTVRLGRIKVLLNK